MRPGTAAGMDAERCDGDLPAGDAHLGARATAIADDEAALIEAARAGNADAFARLYDRHVERVYRQCYYRTGNRSDAEDLTQQTFLKAWQAMPRFRSTGAPFVAWLLTISYHLAMSLHRKPRDLPVGDDWALFEQPTEGPEATVLRHVTFDTVRHAVLELRAERQQVVLLRYLEGFSVEEVAAVLGKSANNVRVIQHRAIADLRRLLGAATTER